MPDSLVIAEQIELMNGGVPSTIAECAGAIFRLCPGFDLSAPQPTSDYVASLVLDGERPVGERASNRTITLPIVIYMVPTSTTIGSSALDAMRTTLVAAREVLMRTINKQHWLLRWTREGSGLPTIFDCYRANAPTVTYSTLNEQQGVIQVSISFPAAPYGRSDVATVASFESPIAGMTAPATAVPLDAFTTNTSDQWETSTACPAGVGVGSMEWDPSQSPADTPTGRINPLNLGVPAILNANPYFASSVGDWVGFNGTVSRLTSPAAGAPNPGGFTTALLYTNGGTTIGAAEESNGSKIAVYPGQSVLVSGYVYSSYDQVILGVDWQTSTSTFLSTSTVTQAVTVNTWTWVARVCTAPPNAAFCYPRVGPNALSATVQLQGVTAMPAPGATYAAGNLNANLAQGWSATCQGTAVDDAYFIATGTASLNISVGDQFQLWTSGGALIQSQIFTVTAITVPGGGFANVSYTPASAAGTVSGNVAVQCGPPQLPAVTVWAGFGSSNYYNTWCRRGGAVHFLLTLYDNFGNALQSSKIVTPVYGSSNSASPKWMQARITLNANTSFNYAKVIGYSLTVTNFTGTELAYSQLYVATLTAVPSTTQITVPERGVVYSLAGMVGSARCAPNFQFQQAGTYVDTTVSFTQPGVQFWPCPYDVTSVNVFGIGGGGTNKPSSGNGGGGGSGGSSGIGSAVGVTFGNAYKVVVGQGGTQTSAPIASSFTGDSVTVTAPGGNNATTTTGATANAAGTPSGYAGGAGGNGVSGSTGAGGAGGGSGGTGSAGNPGGAASGETGGAAPAAVAGGGPGGRGGTYGFGNGVMPTAGYGGAAGGSPGNETGYLYPGYNGIVQLTYLGPPTFKTLLVHRPGFYAPDEFNPLLPIPPGDAQNGTINYAMPSLVPGINARFNGTYSVIVAAKTWNTPSASRTITVTVTQWEAPNGNSYAQEVAWTFVPNNLPLSTPFVALGVLTIPLNEFPPDNLNGFYTISIDDTNASDVLYDVIFLDTQGSTVMIVSPNEYLNMWIDEPLATEDIGLILGSVSDRSTAISVFEGAQVITGEPLTVDPNGNQSLLAYCIEGAPNMLMTYYPRWILDRLS
jgi:hypothetical protein